LFKDIGSRPRFDDPEQFVQFLEGAGVGAAVVSIMQPEQATWVGDAHRRFPDRVLPAMIVDPTKGMNEIRRVAEYYERHGVRCLRIPPFRYETPPTDRIYWPFHVKVIELDIPVSMNVGMPGSRPPGWVQDPIYLDEVAYYWPECRLIMTHIGQPWIGEMMSVLVHWDNVFLATTAVAPKYWPARYCSAQSSRRFPGSARWTRSPGFQSARRYARSSSVTTRAMSTSDRNLRVVKTRPQRPATVGAGLSPAPTCPLTRLRLRGSVRTIAAGRSRSSGAGGRDDDADEHTPG